MPLLSGYNPSKLKPQLKMAVTRFQISSNKKSALMKQQIREIATLLADSPPKEEKARIKAEALIRDDNTVEAYELLQLTCELLSERIHLISHSKDCPPDLLSSISTLIWASTVVDIPELIEIRRQFRYKYGKEFESAALGNVDGVIHDRVAMKLSVQPPGAYLVQTYLERIAEEHEVQWKPRVGVTAEKMAEPMPAPMGESVRVGGGSGLMPTDYVRASAPPPTPMGGFVEVTDAIQEEEEVDIYVPGRSMSSGGTQHHHVRGDSIESTGGESYDDLAARFAKYVPVPPVPDAIREEGEDIHVPGRSMSKCGTQHHHVRGDSIESTGGESYDDLAARFAKLQR